MSLLQEQRDERAIGSRRKKLEKIGFEELMGAAGMSGFGALLEPLPVRATGGWRLPVELRVRFSLQGAALAERLGRQNDMLRSLNGSMARRVTSLEQALEFLSRISTSTPVRRSHTLYDREPQNCAAAVPESGGVDAVEAVGSPQSEAEMRFHEGRRIIILGLAATDCSQKF